MTKKEELKKIVQQKMKNAAPKYLGITKKRLKVKNGKIDAQETT